MAFLTLPLVHPSPFFVWKNGSHIGYFLLWECCISQPTRCGVVHTQHDPNLPTFPPSTNSHPPLPPPFFLLALAIPTLTFMNLFLPPSNQPWPCFCLPLFRLTSTSRLTEILPPLELLISRRLHLVMLFMSTSLMLAVLLRRASLSALSSQSRLLRMSTLL